MTIEAWLYKLNKLFALLLVAWACYPWLGQNAGLIGGFFFAGGWCVSAMLLSKKHAMGIDGFFSLLYLCVMVLSYIDNGKVYANMPMYYYVSMVILFFLPYYMFMFYLKREDARFLGTIAFISILCMLAGALTSSYYTYLDSNVMKTISQKVDTEFVDYRKAGIGSFGFIYMLVFSLIAIVGKIKTRTLRTNKWLKVLLLFFCIAGIKCIVDSTFATALILLVVGTLVVLLMQPNATKRNVLICFLCLFVVISAGQLLGSFLEGLTLESEDVTIRLHEIGSLLKGEAGGENTESRFVHFRKSVECFLQYPLTGYNFAKVPVCTMGGHSEWIDIFAVYGLLGAVPLLATIVIKLRRTAMAVRTKLQYPFFSVLLFIFIIFGFVDPFLRLYHLGFVMFLLIPGISCLGKTSKIKGEKT